MATRRGLGTMEDAPDWYGTPLDELEFEWSPEEKLELERYCETISKNASEEEMTPKERFEATMGGKEKDRLFIDCIYIVPFAARTLDGWSDSVKPGDIYQRPKLHVKAHLATAARYKLDMIDVYTIAYNEEFWGANARMMDYGTPMVLGQPPIKSLEDMEGLEVPDPKEAGLYPGYLWAVREIKRILARYGLDEVIPLVVSYCPGPMGAVMMLNTMMSMPAFMKALRKEPEVVRRAMEVTSEWSVKFGKAVKELKPDGMYLCDISGAFPTGFDWALDYTTNIAKGVQGGDPIPMWQHLGCMGGWLEWMPRYVERGVLGHETFWGWFIDSSMPPKEVYEFSREHDLYCASTVSDELVLKGQLTDIEEEIRRRAEYAKLHPKHGLGLGAVDYWTRPEFFDATMELARQYGRF